MKSLSDQAMFSDSFNAKRKAVDKLSKFGSDAIPFLVEIMETISSDKQGFKTYCKNKIMQISSFDKHYSN